MKRLKKYAAVLFSMKTALILLGLLIIACVVGSVIPQREIDAYYTGYYPEKLGMLMLLLGLNDVFHAGWFVFLTAFLCVNLLGCNLIHLPALLKQLKSGFSAEKCLHSWDGTAEAVVADPKPLFRAMGFRTVTETTWEGKHCLYAARNKAGCCGAWLTHLGMLIIILGFALGQLYTVQYTVYGVPGQTKPVADTGYSLTIDDFSITLREDETVEQYTSTLTLRDDTGNAVTGQASVNHPLKAMGMKLYQNSTGWAAQVLVYKGETLVQHEILCAGEQLAISGIDDLVFSFRAFYPDYVITEDGTPATASSALNNPAYLYALYYQGRVLGMNVLTSSERITVEDYTILPVEPQQYTLIQIKHDPFTWLAGLGGIVICAALLLAFYLRTEELWAVEEETGWSVAGKSRKGGVLFHERLAEKAQECEKQ